MSDPGYTLVRVKGTPEDWRRMELGGRLDSRYVMLDGILYRRTTPDGASKDAYIAPKPC